MEPPDEARRWISDLLGVAVDGHLSGAVQGWAALLPALDAIRDADVPAETLPAILPHLSPMSPPGEP